MDSWRCLRFKLLTVVLTISTIIAALLTVLWFGNPQWKYRYFYRNVPWNNTLAPIDDVDARKRLKSGMTREMVLDILGTPVSPNGGTILPDKELRADYGDGCGIWCYSWKDTCDYFYVIFDKNGRVESFGLK